MDDFLKNLKDKFNVEPVKDDNVESTVTVIEGDKIKDGRNMIIEKMESDGNRVNCQEEEIVKKLNQINENPLASMHEIKSNYRVNSLGVDIVEKLNQINEKPLKSMHEIINKPAINSPEEDITKKLNEIEKETEKSFESFSEINSKHKENTQAEEILKTNLVIEKPIVLMQKVNSKHSNVRPINDVNPNIQSKQPEGLYPEKAPTEGWLSESEVLNPFNDGFT